MGCRKTVKQENNYGCGVACVAFIIGKSYRQTLKLFENGYFEASNYGFNCKDIINALSKSGLKYSYHYINSKRRRYIYKNYSIVFIKRSKQYPSGHYLCRFNHQWMDSWINFSENKNIKEAKAGFRKMLPEKPIYIIRKLTNIQIQV